MHIQQRRLYPLPLGAAITAALLLCCLAASSASAIYQNRYEIYVYPKNTVEDVNIYTDPCYTNFSWLIWMECPSHEAAPQYHNWTEENVTNTGNREGYIEGWGFTREGYTQEYVWAYGGKGTFAYSNKLPGKLKWPISGATGWFAGNPAEGGDWEQTRGKLDSP